MITLKAATFTATLLAVSTLPAQAGDHVYDVSHPAYRNECTSCHVAYPPQLLPAESWRKLMTGLDKHFGTDASVDAKTAADISRYLEGHAASGRKAWGDTPLRISETAWFTREHRKVPAALWSGTAVKNAANCAACHTRAESGDYSERTLRLPR